VEELLKKAATHILRLRGRGIVLGWLGEGISPRRAAATKGQLAVASHNR